MGFARSAEDVGDIRGPPQRPPERYLLRSRLLISRLLISRFLISRLLISLLLLSHLLISRLLVSRLQTRRLERILKQILERSHLLPWRLGHGSHE